MIETPAILDASTELVADLARLRELVERSDVDGARQLIQELKARWPDSAQVENWKRVLEPPKASVVKDSRVRNLDQERNWLRDNASNYPGCWLAVLGNSLIAADPDLRAVLAAARQVTGGDRAFLHLQPQAAERT